MDATETAEKEDSASVEPTSLPWFPAVIAVATTIVGAALSVGVMVGLLGVPVAGVGLVVTTITSRRLMGLDPSTRYAWLVGLVGNLAGLATSIACLAFADGAGEGLLAEARGRGVLDFGALGHAALAHPLLWVAGPLLGAVALRIARNRSMASWGFAISLWAAAPPATAILVSRLYANGWIALTA
jgi:hypothetical protein